MKADLSTQPLPVLVIGEIALTEMVAAQLGMKGLPEIKADIHRSGYWPEFVALAKAGQVEDNWIPGMIGKVVLGWAKATK